MRAPRRRKSHGAGVMKNTFLLPLLALASVTATLSAAADDCDTSKVYTNTAAVAPVTSFKSVKALVVNPNIKVGDSRMNVVKRLGSPSIRVSAEVWVYDRFHVENPAPGQEKLVHLIVRFDGRRVARTELASAEYVADLRDPKTDPSRALALK